MHTRTIIIRQRYAKCLESDWNLWQSYEQGCASSVLDRVEEDDGTFRYTVEVFEEDDEESCRRSNVYQVK